ncbi:MAG: hypothetical protein EBX41_00230 [Chitinophagia bacterium]|nr:hypothetical protein [Chitinophagia bacterium]
MVYFARMFAQIMEASLQGTLIAMVMAISVGPTLLAIIKYSMHSSRKAALAFVLGVSVSDIMYVSVANLATSWLKMLESHIRYIGTFGGLLLVIVGLIGFWGKRTIIDPNQAPDTISGSKYFRIWLSGFLVNSLNPGVIVSWLSLVTVAINHSGFYRLVLFGVCLFLVLGIDVLKILLAAKIKKLLTPLRIGYVQNISSLLFVAIGIWLIITTWQH